MNISKINGHVINISQVSNQIGIFTSENHMFLWGGEQLNKELIICEEIQKIIGQGKIRIKNIIDFNPFYIILYEQFGFSYVFILDLKKKKNLLEIGEFDKEVQINTTKDKIVIADKNSIIIIDILCFLTHNPENNPIIINIEKESRLFGSYRFLKYEFIKMRALSEIIEFAPLISDVYFYSNKIYINAYQNFLIFDEELNLILKFKPSISSFEIIPSLYEDHSGLIDWEGILYLYDMNSLQLLNKKNLNNTSNTCIKIVNNMIFVGSQGLKIRRFLIRTLHELEPIIVKDDINNIEVLKIWYLENNLFVNYRSFDTPNESRLAIVKNE